MAAVPTRAVMSLSDFRPSLADLSSLFERVCELQNSPVIVVLADDLEANGPAV